MLKGIRGNPPVDFKTLTDVLLKVSQFLTDHGDAVKELDINPLIVFKKGAKVADALIVKGPRIQGAKGSSKK